MKPPAHLPESERTNLSEVSPGSTAIIAAEVSDLEREIKVARRKATWHRIWVVLGLSPAAMIPAIGLMREGSTELLFLLAVLVTISQAYLGAKAAKKAGELEARLKELMEADPRSAPH